MSPVDLRDRLDSWARRLELAADTVRLRHADPVTLAAVETVESVAAEARAALAHVSTWPAPPEGS